MYRNKNTKSFKKPIVALLLLVAIVLSAYFIRNPSTNRTKQDESRADNVSQTTSTTPTAQDDFSDGAQRQPGNSLGEDQGSGYIKDSSSGANQSIPDKSEWIISNTGEITVYSPSKNSTLKTGDTISGESTLQNVSFRLIDNISGVIAQGQLDVRNGKFSGVFNFQTNASEGRLDLFATDNQAVEFSNIEIPLKL